MSEMMVLPTERVEFRLGKRKNEFGEYVIMCWKEGKRYTDGDYYTDDADDALGTLKHLREWAKNR